MRVPGRRWLHPTLSLLLALSLASPGLAASAQKGPAKGQGAATSWAASGSGAVQIDPELAATLAHGGSSTFIVTLSAQAEIKGAAQAARSAAKRAGQTPRAQRLASANAVVNALKGVATESQKGLLGLLKRLEANGSVSDYQAFYITNAVAVTGDQAALEAIQRIPGVAKIEPSRTFHVMGAQDGAAGASASVGTSGGSTMATEWNIDMINAPAAWGLGFDGTGVVVASLDTGVDGNHPALAAKWRGADGSGAAYSWYDAVNNRNTFPYDDHGHGTHTTGTMVGSEPDGSNQIGVAPGAQWIAAKILNSGGSGTDVDIIEAGEWILAPGGDPAKAPDVVSNSWGGGPGMDEWFRPVVQAWREAGIVPVFAAGNDGPGAGTVSAPGNYPEAITVGAVDSSSNLASFSGQGPSPYGEIKPEVSAPGVGIRSAVPGGGYEGGWSGTSMATPHVTGVVALLRQVNASFTVDDIEQILTQTAIPTTSAAFPTVPNNGFGHGVINAFDAVAAASSGLGTLSGRVVIAGDDLEPPTLSHTPVAGPTFAGTTVPVTATVSDNVSITEVTLFAKAPSDSYYTAIPMAQTAGDYRSGTFRAVIPAELVQVPAFSYYIRALDYGNNPVATPEQSVEVLSGLQPGWSSDLEAEPFGWQHGGNADPWQWGAPTSGPGAAHSGSNLWATNLSGNYNNAMNAYLALPPIDLTGSTGAILRYQQWFEFENNYDHGEVWVIDQAGTQTKLTDVTGASGGWRSGQANLSPWAGQRIFVLFNARSDSSVTKAGWYLDDLALIGSDAEAPAAPANLTATVAPDGSVNLAWSANSELDLGSYNLYRSATSGSGYTQIGTSATNSFTDAGAPVGAESFYVVTAVDLWGNGSGYSNEASALVQGDPVLYFDDFESGAPGWSHSGTGDTWALGAPTSGPGAAYSGSNLWATNLAGNYANGANASLVSPPILLDGDHPSLRFAHWYDLETNWDFGYVEISTNDGATWTLLGTRLTGNSSGWQRATVDLTPYAHQTVRLRFRQTSDGSVTKVGWYLDDVKVVAASGATNLGAELNTGKAPEKLDDSILWEKKETLTTSVVESSEIGINALPISATVTILETDRSTRTNPANGEYSLRHAAGTYTAMAEAYGYYPVSQAVTVTADGTTMANFMLQPIPQGQITGIVTDAVSGAPIEGATLRVMEDSAIVPVTTDASGAFALTVYEGSYTLQVTAPDYHGSSQTVSVTGGDTLSVAIALEPFIGYDASLVYDDGSAENAWAYYDAGNGWAVRMSPDPAKGSAMLTGAGFYVWGTDWPAPGGTAYAVAIYDASGPDGSPGQRLAGPIVQTATRGTWNAVDLSSLGLSFDGDFYVAFIQQGAYPNVPGLAADESSGSTGRSWQLVGGNWAQMDTSDGNMMIRANVQYAVGSPTITSPVNGSATNQAEVMIEGTAVSGVTVNLYQDGALAGSGTADGGHFAIPATLHDGENAFTVTAAVDGRETRSSAPVVVTLDQTAPVVTITAPVDGTLTNLQVTTVAGSVEEANLSALTVGGTAVQVSGGAFSHQLILADGANLITVTATDAAGNTGTASVTITRDGTAPTLTAITPASDVTLMAGESLTISFDAEPGLTDVGYRIVLAGAGSAINSTDPVNMTETSPGHYEGTFTAPAETAFAGAQVQVWAIDAAGNRASGAAVGRLTVALPTPNQAPTAVITPPAKPQAKKALTFSAASSTDPDGTIVSYLWNWGDGSAESTGVTAQHTYAKKGTYLVTLTVTDDKGAMTSVTYSLVVK